MSIAEEQSDTIAAVTTGGSRSAVGMIRISGPEALAVGDRIFRNSRGRKLQNMATYTAAYGRICRPAKENSPAGKPDGEEETLDEAVALVMRGPHSYTTEDTVEFSCHGGPFVLQQVLEAALQAGARPANPGEFTKRAFLGGRIDMSEAEAVMDVVDAENRYALDAGLRQLSGGLRQDITALREKILYQTAFIESALDDPEHYSLDGFPEKLEKVVQALRLEIRRLIQSFREGRLIREGIRTAITGRPNVGKSSLLNRLLGENRAIVTAVAGTTRDTLEEDVNLGNITLRLIDTAGIRETSDEVEKIGVEKAEDTVRQADLILLVLDSTTPLTAEDDTVIRGVAAAGKPVITLMNKQDLAEAAGDNPAWQKVTERIFRKLPENCRKNMISISARTGAGTDELKRRITDLFFQGSIGQNDQVVITSVRHRDALVRADEALSRVEESIRNGLGEDFYTIDLMAAYEALGGILGETLEDDLADKIFSEFCMGK